MNLKKLATQFALLGALGMATAVPLNAQAQTVTHWIERQTKTNKEPRHGHDQRQRQRSHHDSGKSWQSLSYVGAGVGVLGLLTHSPALVGIGIAGGLYSTYRFEQDRKSVHQDDRRRASYFSQTHRTIDGHPYHRTTVMDNGHHYYAYKRD